MEIYLETRTGIYFKSNLNYTKKQQLSNNNIYK